MISYIKGVLEDILEDHIVVEAQQIGYLVNVPLTVIDQMPSIGSQVKIYTYMYVREDALSLYGFLTKDDLRVFKLLITVNGIGPKGALGILSTITPDDLRFAVMAGDIKVISSAPGIGKKTAQKLIIELSDKLKFEDTLISQTVKQGEASTSSTSEKDEAILALVALGYSQTESLKAIRMIDISAEMTSDEILKLALKKIITL